MKKKDYRKFSGGRGGALYQDYARMERKALMALLEARDNGLTTGKVLEKQEKYGKNVITAQTSTPLLLKFMASILNPFSLVLLVIAAVSYFVDVHFAAAGQKSYATFLIILAMVLASGVMEFMAKRSSETATAQLKALVHTTARVYRDGVLQTVALEDIVPGDVVHLSAGDMLPADVRFLSCRDLFVGQASLTGESEPIEKFSHAVTSPVPLTDLPNMAFLGSDIVSGSALALIVATGDSTYLASIAHALDTKRVETGFEKGIRDVSGLLMKMMLVMLPLILLINGFFKSDWLNATLFALSVAVGLTPELLPMIMSSTLARGSLRMARKKVIVKNPSSIQNFGAMDVLCTDKTGTLTEDRIVLERYLDTDGKTNFRILRHAYFNSFFQTGLRNMIDKAVIERAEKDFDFSPGSYLKIDEIPFDFKRRRMTVVIKDGKGKKQLITKGAVEEMLDACSSYEREGNVLPLDASALQHIQGMVDRMNDEGLRVLGIAHKLTVLNPGEFSVADETDMVFIGFVAFMDPPKLSARTAVTALEQHGVRVVVLTGDNERVSRTVCRKIGIPADRVLLGQDIDDMDDTALQQAMEEVSVCAKLSPQQKARIVRCMHDAGHTVGYMGDGINDASAMHQADVAVSVESAVDIARETADIILLEKSLMVLEEGVLEGRRTFGNIIKYIKMAASGNFGNMLSVLFASIFLPFLPILPVQLLAQNLLYDISQLAIPFDYVDDEYLTRPRTWNAKSIGSFMFILGPLSSFFDICAFLVLYYVMGFRTVEQAVFFQSSWFVFGLVSQTVVVHLIRTPQVPFFKARSSIVLVASTVVVALVGIISPFTPLGIALDMVRIPWKVYGYFALILAGYVCCIEAVKLWYRRTGRAWL